MSEATRIVSAGVLAIVSAVPSVFLHPLGWPIPLIALTAGALLLALPSGWPRVIYAGAWTGIVLMFTFRRTEGDLVMQDGLQAYLLLALALVLVVAALVTLPRRRARHWEHRAERT